MCNAGSSESPQYHPLPPPKGKNKSLVGINNVPSLKSNRVRKTEKSALIPRSTRLIDIETANRLLKEDSLVLARRFDSMRWDVAKQLGLTLICSSLAAMSMSVAGLLGYYGVLRMGSKNGEIPENPSLGLKVVGVLAGLASWGTMTSFEATATTALFNKFNALCIFCRKFIKNPQKAICENGQTLIVAIFAGGPILLATSSTVKATYDAFRPLVGWVTYFVIPVHIVRIGMSWIWRYKFQQDLKSHYKRMIASAMCDLENYRLQETLEGMLKDMGEQRGNFTHTKFRRLAISFNNAYNRQERIELLFRELRKELLRKTGVDIFKVEKQVKSQCCEPWSLVRQCCVTAAVVLSLYSGITSTIAARNLGPIIADLLNIEIAGSVIGAFMAVACFLTNVPKSIVYGTDVGKELATHIEGLQCCGKENRSGFYKTQAASDWIIRAAGFGLSVGFVATRVGLAGANPLFKVGGSNIPYCLSIVPGSAVFGYRACVNNIRKFYNNNVKAYSLAPSARQALLKETMDEELNKAVDQFCRTCCCCAKDVKRFEVTLAILRVFIEEAHKDLTDSRGELSMILASLRKKQ